MITYGLDIAWKVYIFGEIALKGTCLPNKNIGQEREIVVDGMRKWK